MPSPPTWPSLNPTRPVLAASPPGRPVPPQPCSASLPPPRGCGRGGAGRGRAGAPPVPAPEAQEACWRAAAVSPGPGGATGARRPPPAPHPRPQRPRRPPLIVPRPDGGVARAAGPRPDRSGSSPLVAACLSSPLAPALAAARPPPRLADGAPRLPHQPCHAVCGLRGAPQLERLGGCCSTSSSCHLLGAAARCCRLRRALSSLQAPQQPCRSWHMPAAFNRRHRGDSRAPPRCRCSASLPRHLASPFNSPRSPLAAAPRAHV